MNEQDERNKHIVADIVMLWIGVIAVLFGAAIFGLVLSILKPILLHFGVDLGL